MTFGAAVTGSLIGMSAILYMQKSEKRKQREQKMEVLKERKRKYMEKKTVDQMIKEMKEGKKLKRRVHLYFDENDEMIERDEEEPEE